MLIRTAHLSMQFSDNDRQHASDANRLFDRARDRRYAWITGTEAGPGSGRLGYHLVRAARASGYRPWVPSVQGDGVEEYTGSWIAVRRDLIRGGWKRGFKLAVPSSGVLRRNNDIPARKRWGPRGLTHVRFNSLPEIGRVNIGSAHYLTGGQQVDNRFGEWNRQISEVIGRWATTAGLGSSLVFYGGDQNMLDNRNDSPQGDTFFGAPLTSTWDELQKWENTGHGNIDVIATYNRDKRVRALRTHALDDSEFHLHTDHFLVEALFRVDPLNH